MAAAIQTRTTEATYATMGSVGKLHILASKTSDANGHFHTLCGAENRRGALTWPLPAADAEVSDSYPVCTRCANH